MGGELCPNIEFNPPSLLTHTYARMDAHASTKLDKREQIVL